MGGRQTHTLREREREWESTHKKRDRKWHTKKREHNLEPHSSKMSENILLTLRTHYSFVAPLFSLISFFIFFISVGRTESTKVATAIVNWQNSSSVSYQHSQNHEHLFGQRQTFSYDHRTKTNANELKNKQKNIHPHFIHNINEHNKIVMGYKKFRTTLVSM